MSQRYVNYSDLEKFRAELFRLLAILTGTPLGTFIMKLLFGDIKYDQWFLLRVFVIAIFSLLCFLLFDKSYSIMKSRDEKYNTKEDVYD